jgi:hypothetical protein
MYQLSDKTNVSSLIGLFLLLSCRPSTINHHTEQAAVTALLLSKSVSH